MNTFIKSFTALLLTILFFMGEVMADSSDALGVTLKAVKQTKMGQKTFNEHKDRLNHKLKKIQEELGEDVVTVAITAILSKALVEGGIKHKIKLGEGKVYSVDADFSGEITSGLSGRLNDYKNTSYDVMAYTKNSDQGIRVGIRVTFD